MSASTSAGGCHTCTRKSITPAGPPTIIIGHSNGSLDYDISDLQMVIMNNFDGDLSSPCGEKAREKIETDFLKALDAWANDPEISEFLCFDSKKDPTPCYGARLSAEYTLTMKCTCNDKDISEGKGPPKAEAKSSGMELVFDTLAHPCNDRPTGGNPGVGLRC